MIEDQQKKVLKNISYEQLPFLNCSCPSRYDPDFRVKDDSVSASLRDAIELAKFLFEGSTDMFERVNEFALHIGFVDFSKINGFEGYVQDGSQNEILNLKTLESFKEHRNTLAFGSTGRLEQVHKLDIKNFSSAHNLTQGNIIHWRRKMLGISSDGKILNVDYSMYSGPDSKHNEHTFHPKEWVIVSQIWLCEMFANLKEDSVHIVFVDLDVSFTSRMAYLSYQQY